VKFDLGKGLRCDLAQLVDSRLLVQANSGGGKSWCLRRLLEQTHGHVQQLVIDPEGEFASLREQFDYVWAAKAGGDTAADPRSAKLLAERLLELGVSAILDIYELKAHERIRFVRGFLEAMVNAPKKLWHPALVVVDEAHVYCPQKGEAESAGAVIDLCTRGRKRGYCAVLATQRLSKLHKDAAAELNNKLIGRTGLDVDIARAADELGFTSKEQQRGLRELTPGEFFAFGPALAAGIARVTIGAVQTSHPKAGARIAFTPPPPTAKVKALLPKLADLPAEAEQKQRSEADLKRELASVRAEVTRLQRSAPARTIEKVKTVVEKVEVPVLTEAQVRRLETAAQKIWTASDATLRAIQDLKGQIAPKPGSFGTVRPQVVNEPRRTRTETETARPVQTSAKPNLPRTPIEPAADGAPLPKGELAVLRAVADYPEGCSRKQLTVLTGYRRSTRDTYLQRLGERGYVELRGATAVATEAGLAVLGPDFEPLPIGSALLAHWRSRLPEGERKLLDLVVTAYPESIDREVLSEGTGFKRSSRDTYLQRLGAKRLVQSVGRGAVKASDLLFDGASR
jgi:hypothetical protein